MENWPVLMTFTYPTEAHLVKGYLESNGIETIINDELTAQVANIYSNAIGGVKLRVSESDYNQGIQLLKDGGYLQEEDYKSESKVEIVLLDKATNKKICLFCSSDNITLTKKPGILTTVVLAIINLFIMIGAIFPMFKSSFKCFDCGKEWKYKRE
ncbi:MAG: DUF2007 domain-containing protein [Bacteroidia bacterium]|nr:DUF2007 domain-containing protein [Bacteroidia bacterium]